tara:strand:- start:1523 stop:1720 length:198 start_codon:yes stop_codon:yes gene_type:complete
MKDSGAPSIGDIVQVLHTTARRGLVVEVKGARIGIIYFKSWKVVGVPLDHVWWVHRANVKVISAA